MAGFSAIRWVDSGFIKGILPQLSDEYSGNALFDADISDIDVHGLH